MYSPQQSNAMAAICAAGEESTEVQALYCFGSWGTDAADQWSDLDLLAISNSPSVNWLPELGVVFSCELNSDSRGQLFRLYYDHGLAIDLLNVSPTSIKNIGEWERRPFGKGIRPLISGCESFNVFVLGNEPTEQEADISEIRQSCERVKFLATLAVRKHIRNECLIAKHLALECMQAALVAAMIANERHSKVNFGPSPHQDTVISIVLAAASLADQVGSRYIDDYRFCFEVIEALCLSIPANGA
jgi:hypothetical protein